MFDNQLIYDFVIAQFFYNVIFEIPFIKTFNKLPCSSSTTNSSNSGNGSHEHHSHHHVQQTQQGILTFILIFFPIYFPLSHWVLY